MLAVPEWLPLQQLAIALSALASLLALVLLERPDGSWSRHLRRRFVTGVPWGTLVAVAWVTGVYLFVQSALRHWNAPVVVPFRAWSYFYPLGMLTAAFSHVGPSHLIGNLVGTLTLAPLAEYAWGHFPRKRGSTSFGSWRTNPYVRGFVLFPLAVVAVGLATSLFAIGPIIGFSGVVFAFAGFALVYYPLGTVLALVAGQTLRLLYTAFLVPRTVATAEPSFSTPWWAQIAIQGHALGLLIGALLAVFLVHRRGDDTPSSLRLFTGALLFAVAESLWAVYWFRGNETFVLFRAVGVALVFLLATLITVAGTASDRPLFGGARHVGERAGVPRWQAAAVALLLGTALISGGAVPVNLMTTSDEPLPGDPLTIRDYEVTYAENVTSGMVAVVDVEAFGETTSVRTSGVIVRSERRGIWTTAVSSGRLSFRGRSGVRIGGVGWREVVVANRTGWSAVGGPTAYRVNLSHRGETTTAFTSPPATAEPVVAGRNVTLNATPSRFTVAVTQNNTTRGVAPLPGRNESVTVDGIRFVRNESRLFAVYNDTRVRVATAERYRG